VLNTDLAPTIAALARVTPSLQVDGRSLLPLMQNPALATWRRVGLIEHSVTITDSNFGFPPSYLALRFQLPTPLTYVRYPSLTTGVNGELYDLAADPFQLENRFEDPASATVISQLNLRIALLYGCRGSSCVYFENN
jgi:arylsulfatase A-like enzyme